ncbi:MAG TPA: serine/threonine-protein kinase [Polyangiaceae bacterium]|nr:serine/threonine-protein kinase [Polyangiaceae bacterium]
MTPERLGDCRIIDRIDEGPLTVLYRAVQEPLGRPVAVKALRGSISPSSPLAQGLVREAARLAPLRHPAVPALYNFLQGEAGMWLVLEPFEGVTLAALIAKSPRGLEPPAALSIAVALAEVLAYLHGRGLVHGDLRPEHVLVSPRGEVKLTEFGAVRGGGEPALAEGAADFGPPHYLAPEQLLGEPPDPRSDLFSLGVLFFQMLTGARPFDAADPRGVTRRIRHDAPTRLTSLAAGVPASLERVVERCLEKDPEARFPSAAALLEELARAAVEVAPAEGVSAVSQALARAGLGEPSPATSSAIPNPRGPSAPPRPPRGATRAFVGQLVALGAMALGASVIQVNARERPGAEEASSTLELVPDRAAALRVVARPWATVFVDGQLIDVTPFAKAIPLRAGTHHVHFRHPSAPDVKRLVTLAPGATALVEVEMAVPPPPPPPSAPAPAPVDTTP